MILLTREPPLGGQDAIDVRSSDERLLDAVERLEKLTAWFDAKLPHAAPRPR